MAVDWNDPCARAIALREAYYSLVSGQQEVVIETRTLDAMDRVQFSAPNLASLRAEMERAESECAASTGATNPNRRHAIGFRSKRGY